MQPSSTLLPHLPFTAETLCLGPGAASIGHRVQRVCHSEGFDVRGGAEACGEDRGQDDDEEEEGGESQTSTCGELECAGMAEQRGTFKSTSREWR